MEVKNIREISLLAIAIFSSTFVSCTKDGEIYNTSNAISINVIGHPYSKSGDAGQISTRIIKSDDPGFYLEETVSVVPFDIESKGAIITTKDNNAINTDGKSFRMESWLATAIDTAPNASTTDKDNHHFMSAVPTRNSGKWDLQKEFWRNGIQTTFWSYYVPSGAPAPSFKWPGSENFDTADFGTGKPSDEALTKLYFTYSLPAPGGEGSGNDAHMLQDFLVAYNCDSRVASSTDGSINIKFAHPLAAVKFTMGTIKVGETIKDDPDDNEYVRITQVKLIDVKTSGSFIATGSGTNVCTISTSSTSGEATYSQDATRAEIKEGKFTGTNSEYVFFMIPQDVNGVTVELTMVRKKKTITYKSDGTTIDSISYGEDITFTRKVNLSGTWDPGKYYTYQINSVVYFGGEEVKLPKDQIEKSSDDIKIEGDKMSFTISGSVPQTNPWSAWVAPLPTSGVNILKLDLKHYYKCASGKSHRHVWLEAAKLNPNYIEGSTDPSTSKKYIGTGLLTKDSRLVGEVTTILNDSGKEKYKDYIKYWPNGYRGILGDSPEGSTPGIDDRNMNVNGAKEDTQQESVMYFYLGGDFEYVMIHFEYWSSAGDGIWTAELPIFNITEIVE